MARGKAESDSELIANNTQKDENAWNEETCFFVGYRNWRKALFPIYFNSSQHFVVSNKSTILPLLSWSRKNAWSVRRSAKRHSEEGNVFKCQQWYGKVGVNEEYIFTSFLQVKNKNQYFPFSTSESEKVSPNTQKENRGNKKHQRKEAEEKEKKLRCITSITFVFKHVLSKK